MARSFEKRSTPGSLAAVGLILALVVACSDTAQDVDLSGEWVPDAVPSASIGPGFDPLKATIRFSDDGTWTASDGCNELSGTYTIDGDKFKSPPGGALLGVGCVHGQVQYADLLEDAAVVTESDALVEFYDDSGNMVLRLRRTD